MAGERECYGSMRCTQEEGVRGAWMETERRTLAASMPAVPAPARRGRAASGLCLAAAAAALLMGCAGPKAKAGPIQAAGHAVRVEEGGDLSGLDKAAKSPEDRLVLDLMLGYRMLLLRDPDAKSLDKGTLQRSREAFDRLETILRHGGVKTQDKGERVYAVSDGDKLSLQEVILATARVADKAARAGDWDRARDRWKEIVQSKTAVAFILEEAQWGLTLTDALQAKALPDSLKKSLRDVNESYLSDAGHEEVGKQVKALLEIVPDVKLQRELKKLANRSWEKDRRAGRIGAQSQASSIICIAPPADTAKAAEPSTAEPSGAEPAPGTAQPPGDAAAIAAEADSLSGKGKYVAALKALERGGPEQSWVREKKAQIGNRFCEDKRRAAANDFKDFKKASTDAAKKALLARTASQLDSCLFYFPDLPVSAKVRKNREMVEGEMQKLK